MNKISKSNNTTSTNVVNNADIPPLINGKVPVLALMEPQDYAAFKSNKAIDKNGIRHRKGNYWSRQPEHRDLPPEMIDVLRRQQNNVHRTTYDLARSSHQAPTCSSSQKQPAPHRNVHAQGGMRIAKVVGSIAIQYVVAPALNQVAHAYVIPFLSTKIGGFFCRVTGWNASSSVETGLRTHQEYYDTKYDSLAKEDVILTSSEQTDGIETLSQSESLPSEKILEFSA